MTHSRAIQISRLKRFQPRATAIRFEDKCPSCKRMALYSYLLDGVGTLRQSSEGLKEECGFYCTNCRWGNAGARPVEDDNEE